MPTTGFHYVYILRDTAYERYLKSGAGSGGGGVKGLPWQRSGWEGGAPGSGFGVGAPLIAARARVDKEERCPGCEEY